MRDIDRLINYVDGLTYLSPVHKAVIRRRLHPPPHEAELLAARLEVALAESVMRKAAEAQQVADVLAIKHRAETGR